MIKKPIVGYDRAATASTAAKYAIGLREIKYQGVWEYEKASGFTASFQKWAPNEPKGPTTVSTLKCAYLDAGIGVGSPGFWFTADCDTTKVYAICKMTL